MAELDAAKTDIDSEDDWRCLVAYGFRAYPRTGLTEDGPITTCINGVEELGSWESRS
jgi:hypothetical protein